MGVLEGHIWSRTISEANDSNKSNEAVEVKTTCLYPNKLGGIIVKNLYFKVGHKY